MPAVDSERRAGVTRTRRGALRWLSAVALGVALSAAAAATLATTTRGTISAPQGASSAKLEVVLLYGTNASTSAIPAGYSELSMPPWNAYNHWEVLSTDMLTLASGTTVNEPLPNGSSFDAVLQSVNGSSYTMDIVVKSPAGAQQSKGTYIAAKGARFKPVALPHNGGKLVPSLTVQ